MPTRHESSREELELRVQERTAELDAVNGELRDEIIERRRAEQDRQELLRQLVVAQEEERRRISRELHDQVGQHVTALLLGLKAIEQENPGGRSADVLESLKSITEQIGREIRGGAGHEGGGRGRRWRGGGGQDHPVAA